MLGCRVQRPSDLIAFTTSVLRLSTHVPQTLTAPARLGEHCPYFDMHLSIGGHPGSRDSFDEQLMELAPHGLESACRLRDGSMHSRISNRAIATVQVISWVAIVIVMGMFLTVIGVSITECLANPR